MHRRPTTRRQAATWLFSVLLALAVLGGFGRLGDTPALAVPTDVGFRDFSFGTAVGSPTGNKAQSKLWFNDGIWWGSLFNPSVNDFYIYRFDKASQDWTSTGTLIDRRNNSKADTLWDGTHLYVASAVVSATGTDQAAKVLRYSYDASTKTYTLDAGFPVTVGNGPMEAITLDKDTTGKLWVTFTQNGQVFVNRSVGSDASWGTPFVPPVAGVNVSPDDISAVVAYDLRTTTPQMGLMWSNQLDDKVYFASHKDSDPDNVWQPTRTVIQGPKSADDHINLKSVQTDPNGRIFAVNKTSFGDVGTPDPNAPLILLTALNQDNSFTQYTFGRVADDHTRPMLITDEENRELYVFATAPVSPGGTIYYKKTPLSNISFPEGRGTPFIQSSTDTTINNATSTKQNATRASGILVLASDDTSNFYLHNTIDIAAADTTDPTIDLITPPEGATYAQGQVVNASYTCADEAGGSGVKSCVGDVPNGSAIDTSTEGAKSFTVTATDNAGNTSSVTRNYTVSGTPPPQTCTITGTASNDSLTGTSGSDVICGLGGNDTLKGVAGNDTLRGGDGNDKLYGGANDDTIDGGPGTDTASFSGSRAAVVASLIANTATGEGSDTLADVENLDGSSRNDDLTGSGLANTLSGFGGADTLSGLDGADKLSGGAGNDTLRGAAGNDSVTGGSDADNLFGDDGSDSVRSKDGVSGNDSVNGGADTDTCVTDATEASIVGCP